jgi:hypothetical protein
MGEDNQKLKYEKRICPFRGECDPDCVFCTVVSIPYVAGSKPEHPFRLDCLVARYLKWAMGEER